MNACLKNISIVLLSMVLVSCGGGGGSSNGAADSGATSQPTWTLGTYAFVGSGLASGNSTNGVTGVVVVGTTGFNTTNGPYSGSNVNISHTINGEGTYTVVSSTTDMVNAYSENAAVKVVHISCLAGSLNVNPLASTGYESTSGTIVATVDANGRYHFSTTQPLSFRKSVDLGSGIPNAPDQLDFEMTNMYSDNDN